ncbi:hypothetical protein SNEBB_006441 [Seison nebaliae]|nr:hypothetical protein SNEBB_006441 [Seison nebaliae]
MRTFHFIVIIQLFSIYIITNEAAQRLSISEEFTIRLNGGTRECFYYSMNKTQSVDMEYQVISAREPTINFFIHDPASRPILSVATKSNKQYTLTAEIDGDYRFCLDNTMSRFTQKLVYLELTPTRMNEDNYDWDNSIDSDDISDLSLKIEEIRTLLNKVYDGMEKAQRYQVYLRIQELKDRSYQEDNFSRVNFWSFINIMIMVFVTLGQVLVIRTLFSDTVYGDMLRQLTIHPPHREARVIHTNTPQQNFYTIAQ